jgi:hypothetical protein
MAENKENDDRNDAEPATNELDDGDRVHEGPIRIEESCGPGATLAFQSSVGAHAAQGGNEPG